MGDDGIKHVSESLRTNTTLTYLNLEGNKIREEGTKYLCGSLKENTTLTHLIFDVNYVGNEGAQYISDFLRVNSTLTYLTLKRNQFKIEGSQIIAESLKVNSGLTYLHVDTDKIGVNSFQSFSESLKFNTTLQNLSLRCMNKIQDECAMYLSESIAVNTTLTSLCISGYGLTGKGIECLIQSLRINSNLVHFEISGSNIKYSELDQIHSIIKMNRIYQFVHNCNSSSKSWKSKFSSQSMDLQSLIISIICSRNNNTQEDNIINDDVFDVLLTYFLVFASNGNIR
eukprot:TRINITY_DN3067_c0_g1_i1.p1 TRINITY_DN3067_c0_g1~~TRINITY_DN3067_c0_g1_i1.p1  ORF type:complete len:284 (-),score=47.78 TRINITY_DN3067_c0_g1_i1:302-1153(-)